MLHGMRMRTACRAIVVRVIVMMTGLLAVGWAQAPDLEPQSKTANVPAISFEFVFHGADPASYAITVDSTGKASYRSEPKVEEGKVAGDPYLQQFLLMPPNRQIIFDLAKDLNFFQKDLNYTKTRVADMGTKTLTFRDGVHENHTSFNYSADLKAQELAKIFQDISTTLEFKRRLERMARFEPLALDSELKNLESAEKAGRLAEVQVLEPVLSRIASDHSVVNVARRRAEAFLARHPKQG